MNFISQAKSRLKCQRHHVPTNVRKALVVARFLDRYRARPDYQRNDYIGWIIRAVRDETRAERLNQMLQELKAGDRYMKMVFNAKP